MIKCKSFIMVTTSYVCDKNCPYCIAKMDLLPTKSEDLEAFQAKITELKEKGYHFKYFVMSGNGEPSLYPFEVLKRIRDIVENAGIFEEKRIQSSGNIFFEPEKFELFKDWIIEITRVSKDYETDSRVLGYKRDYMQTSTYQQAKLRVNVVLLKNMLVLYDMIESYIRQDNVDIVALKILDNVSNDWISENGIGYDDIPNIVADLEFYVGSPTEEYTNYIWRINGKLVTLYNNKNYMKDKSVQNVMWYGDSVL